MHWGVAYDTIDLIRLDSNPSFAKLAFLHFLITYHIGEEEINEKRVFNNN